MSAMAGLLKSAPKMCESEGEAGMVIPTRRTPFPVRLACECQSDRQESYSPLPIVRAGWRVVLRGQIGERGRSRWQVHLQSKCGFAHAEASHGRRGAG